jgi:cellulose synthase/poly-beta-1,6-N-acetylglucosamine synthase-like glycosyltransferase
MILATVSIFLLVLYTLLIGFYYRQWKRLKTYFPSASPSVAVSVVVAARNEEATLPLLLQDLQQQDYPSGLLEVIVVDDFSTDNTGALAERLPQHFRMIRPGASPEASSKKKAIAAGVAAARHELIVVTDADCRVGKKWVYTVADFYRQTGAAFIAAPVKYTYQSSLLQILQVLDFITLQGITAASVSANFGTMCNGANLAYPKKVFQMVNGFEGIDRVPTGDDMLLMYKIWKQAPEKVFYLKSKDAVVTTAAVPTWREFIMQRRRWASKTLLYDDKRLIAVLGFVLLLNLTPFFLLIGGFFQPQLFLHLFFFLLIKGLIEWPFVASVARFYNEQKLLRYFLWLQPLHVFYTVLVGISSQAGTYEWKGRASRGRGALG